MEQIHKKRAEFLINSYLTQDEIIQKSLSTQEVADLFEKGGKRAMIGEVRTWDGKKYKKTGKGDSWEEVRDTHHARTGDHMVKVNKVDGEHVHFDVHDVEGNYVTKHKLPHSQFRENYHPSEVHEVSEHSTGIGSEHVANYHIGAQVEETSPFEEPVVEPVKHSIKLSEEDRKLMNRVRQDETLISFTPRYLMNKYDELKERGLVKYSDSVNGDEMIKLTELGSGLLSKPKMEVSDEIDETEVAKLQSQATKDIKREEITEEDEAKMEAAAARVEEDPDDEDAFIEFIELKNKVDNREESESIKNLPKDKKFFDYFIPTEETTLSSYHSKVRREILRGEDRDDITLFLNTNRWMLGNDRGDSAFEGAKKILDAFKKRQLK